MSTKAQRRAEAIAERQRVARAEAARRNRWFLWGGVAVVVVIAVIVAVVVSGGDDGAKATAHEVGTVTVDGDALPRYSAEYTGTNQDPAIGSTMPTLRGVSAETGEPVIIAPGEKPQMIVFLAHWCPHCQAEVPRLVKLAKVGGLDGVDVSAVATGTTPEAENYPPSAWLRREVWPFPALADSRAQTAAGVYGLSAYPYFVLVGADGKVAGRATGEVPVADIEANATALVAGQPLPLLSSGASSAAG